MMKANGRLLRKTTETHLYVWTEDLAKQKDMVEVDKNGIPLMVGMIAKTIEKPGQVIAGKDGQPIQLPPVDFSPLPDAVPAAQPQVTVVTPIVISTPATVSEKLPETPAVDLTGKTVPELKKILLDEMKYDVSKDTASPQRVSVKWLINKYQELKTAKG